jgi:hypothetical protein
LRVEERTSGPPAVWLHPDGIHGSLSISEREIGRGLPINSITSWATSLLTLGVLMHGSRKRWSRLSRCAAWPSWPIAGPLPLRSRTIAVLARPSRSIGRTSSNAKASWRRWRPKCQSSGQRAWFQTPAERVSRRPVARLIGSRSTTPHRPPTICTARGKPPSVNRRDKESAGVSLRHNQPYLAILAGSVR